MIRHVTEGHEQITFIVTTSPFHLNLSAIPPLKIENIVAFCTLLNYNSQGCKRPPCLPVSSI